jgi:hypothetical protein
MCSRELGAADAISAPRLKPLNFKNTVPNTNVCSAAVKAQPVGVAMNRLS